MLQVLEHGFVEARAVLPVSLGKAVSRQIHQPPALVDREDVNQLGKPRRGRNAGQCLLAGEQVQQRGLADVRAADEGEQKWTPKFGPVAKLDFSGSAGHERTAEL